MRAQSASRDWIVGLLSLASISIPGCDTDNGLRSFASDGCSLFPDQSLITQEDWCDCCFEHDVAYWQGGTEEERLWADLQLRECILEKSGNEELAEVMYRGVRFGGSPYFYNWYRWGYGWEFERKYQALTPEEEELVNQKLKEYFESQPVGPCSDSNES